MKREQEEKSRKRLEEKVLRNKLLLRQAEATAARESEIQEAANKAEKLRQDEIRARGLDKLDLSVQRLREIPLSVYGDELAQRNLSYAVSIVMLLVLCIVIMNDNVLMVIIYGPYFNYIAIGSKEITCHVLL